MLWSLIRILVFIGVAAALTYGAGLIIETPGEVRIAFAGREIMLSPLGFLILALVVMLVAYVVLKIAGFLVALLRFFTGDRTAITRYLDRNRERRGFDALSQSLIALAAGEGRKAQAKAQLAEKLLDRPELTRLINAQSAESTGNTEKALGYYKDMLSSDSTRFVGVQGLLRNKLEDGDTETALKLAEKAFALQPRHIATLDTLFELQTKTRDWAGARRTLAAKVRAASLPKDVGRRREAVLSLADARAALADGNDAKARDSAYAANRIAPLFVPAAALAAELHAKAGEGRQAARIVKKAWTETPHPELAAAFAAIAPDESPEERLARFQPLLKIRADDPETRMVAAELWLAAEDFPGARRVLGSLAETNQTTRSLALMAAIERGEGAPDSVVRGWLAKALDAPRGEAWVCSVCHIAYAEWTPICDNCGSFDTLVWGLPPASTDSGNAAAMLPLIVGALERPDHREEDPADAPGEADDTDANDSDSDSDVESADTVVTPLRPAPQQDSEDAEPDNEDRPAAAGESKL
ncbi:MAG: heme biosynthesis HemY N-terminal domain-containing protein [Pseudomonadota bacterium]